jgi:hypothetical protein
MFVKVQWYLNISLPFSLFSNPANISNVFAVNIIEYILFTLGFAQHLFKIHYAKRNANWLGEPTQPYPYSGHDQMWKALTNMVIITIYGSVP